MDLEQLLKNKIKNRVPSTVFDFFKKIKIKNFYIAGNTCNDGKLNDIDVFPVGKDDFKTFVTDIKPIAKTMNATTYDIDGTIVQLCNYHHDSLKKLVDSFDFSHIQIGVRVNEHIIEDLYYTEAWKNSKLLGTTEYTGSEYPLSSMMRLIKYANRKDFSGRSYIPNVIKILVNIIERRFKDYDDFKDQLDAVDLGLLPEEYEEVGSNVFIELFNLLTDEENKFKCS